MGSVFGWSAGDSSRSNFSCCFDHRYGFPSNIARVYSSPGNLRLVLPVNTSFSSSVTSFQICESMKTLCHFLDQNKTSHLNYLQFKDLRNRPI
ncbi:hypothetical protein POTOM_051380 [Populus tomentosa]|uniref:Uncharacterized protein n=1 Tax=Populus tomentosa TaxID=118781 RepID=A0A8X8C8B1_POPTO|nr:hypothetical protein POTOM_051380 [Populus tomentosa]